MTTEETDTPAGAGEPTPAQLRELATAATNLAARTRAMIERLPVDDDPHKAPLKPVRWKLSNAVDTLDDYQESIADAVESLTRVRIARGVGLCGIPWGVCPEHGNTLRSTGGSTWCKAPDCFRTWNYDRMATPCTEPAVAAATGAKGEEFVLCAGHALDAEQRLDGITVRYWSGREGHGPAPDAS